MNIYSLSNPSLQCRIFAVLESEKDAYSTGCAPDTSIIHTYYCKLSSESIEGLLQLVKYEFGSEDFIFNYCDVPGMLGIQFLARRHEAHAATERDIKLWKNGEIDLYLKTVIGTVTKTEICDLKDFI